MVCERDLKLLPPKQPGSEGAASCEGALGQMLGAQRKNTGEERPCPTCHRTREAARDMAELGFPEHSFICSFVRSFIRQSTQSVSWVTGWGQGV